MHDRWGDNQEGIDTERRQLSKKTVLTVRDGLARLTRAYLILICADAISRSDRKVWVIV